MKIGAHISAKGDLINAPKIARELGCEVFQFFSRSPRGGAAREITQETAEEFRNDCQEFGMESYIHAPYYINFASSNNRISFGSVSAIQEELRRGTLLGVKYVMTHLGSAKDLGEQKAISQAVERIKSIYEIEENWSTKLLLEISAGATNIIGDNFAELTEIMERVDRKDIGICLDTCHLFASGYDIRTTEKINETMGEFKKYMPVNKIKLVHANDSKANLGEHKDRHADIGDGFLGTETFRNLLADPVFGKLDFILETPGDEKRRKKDIELLKSLR